MAGLKGLVKKAAKTGKGAVKSATRTVSTGLSPVTYVPRKAAQGYKTTTKTLKKKY